MGVWDTYRGLVQDPTYIQLHSCSDGWTAPCRAAGPPPCFRANCTRTVVWCGEHMTNILRWGLEKIKGNHIGSRYFHKIFVGSPGILKLQYGRCLISLLNIDIAPSQGQLWCTIPRPYHNVTAVALNTTKGIDLDFRDFCKTYEGLSWAPMQQCLHSCHDMLNSLPQEWKAKTIL